MKIDLRKLEVDSGVRKASAEQYAESQGEISSKPDASEPDAFDRIVALTLERMDLGQRRNELVDRQEELERLLDAGEAQSSSPPRSTGSMTTHPPLTTQTQDSALPLATIVDLLKQTPIASSSSIATPKSPDYDSDATHISGTTSDSSWERRYYYCLRIPSDLQYIIGPPSPELLSEDDPTQRRANATANITSQQQQDDETSAADDGGTAQQQQQDGETTAADDGGKAQQQQQDGETSAADDGGTAQQQQDGHTTTAAEASQQQKDGHTTVAKDADPFYREMMGLDELFSTDEEGTEPPASATDSASVSAGAQTTTTLPASKTNQTRYVRSPSPLPEEELLLYDSDDHTIQQSEGHANTTPSTSVPAQQPQLAPLSLPQSQAKACSSWSESPPPRRVGHNETRSGSTRQTEARTVRSAEPHADPWIPMDPYTQRTDSDDQARSRPTIEPAYLDESYLRTWGQSDRGNAPSKSKFRDHRSSSRDFPAHDRHHPDYFRPYSQRYDDFDRRYREDERRFEREQRDGRRYDSRPRHASPTRRDLRSEDYDVAHARDYYSRKYSSSRKDAEESTVRKSDSPSHHRARQEIDYQKAEKSKHQDSSDSHRRESASQTAAQETSTLNVKSSNISVAEAISVSPRDSKLAKTEAALAELLKETTELKMTLSLLLRNSTPSSELRSATEQPRRADPSNSKNAPTADAQPTNAVQRRLGHKVTVFDRTGCSNSTPAYADVQQFKAEETKSFEAEAMARFTTSAGPLSQQAIETKYSKQPRVKRPLTAISSDSGQTTNRKIHANFTSGHAPARIRKNQEDTQDESESTCSSTSRRRVEEAEIDHEGEVTIEMELGPTTATTLPVNIATYRWRKDQPCPNCNTILFQRQWRQGFCKFCNFRFNEGNALE